MDQQKQTKQNQPANKKRAPLPPVVQLVMAGAAFGLAYVAASVAIDTGRLLEYAVTIILVGLGVRNLVLGLKGLKNKNGNKE